WSKAFAKHRRHAGETHQAEKFYAWPSFGEALLTLSEQFFTLARRIAPITSYSQKAKTSDD
ncbi:hypothetical protein, partial [Sutterella wadsworthensis]